jgi:putative transposase
MPSTYYSLVTHIVFATKRRHPYFNPEAIQEVHRYLGGTIKGLGAEPLIVGGVEDHVHLLVSYKTNQCVADIVREVKKSSTSWLRHQFSDFSWQEGGGVFSVSPERISQVRKYIENQAEHHRKKTFREEYMELLRFAIIDFDEAAFD